MDKIMRICTKCRIAKPFKEFHKVKWSSYVNDVGEFLCPQCKSCRKLSKQSNINNKARNAITAINGLILKRRITSKHSSLLGCNVDIARKYIESKFEPGMTWENYGLWHLDHIQPLNSFDLTKEENLKICLHYSNIQPLWAEDNYSKGFTNCTYYNSLDEISRPN